MAKRKKYTPKAKVDIVLKALKADNMSEVARAYGIRVSLVSRWKKQLLQGGEHIFSTSPDKEVERLKKKVSKLEQLLGKKEVELSLINNFVDFFESPSGG